MKRKPYAIDDRQTPETPSRNPWKWIPTLYFAEALPYVTVMSISTVMYERMGLSNAEIAFYTSALYLPWVVKPLWSPFIDLAKSKRWWILAMEFLIAAAIAGVAFTLPSAHFLVFTLMFLWMMAFSSATHDIAADGFYMLALDPHEQSLYVGIRSTFYRIATIAGSGLLIMLAGTLETFTRRIAYSWSIAFYVLAAFFIAVTAYHFFHLPRPDCDRTRKAVSARSLWKDIWLTVTSFFRKPQPVAAVLFMLFYRLPEALLIRISNLFLIKPVSEGGLGLSTQEVGFVQGTVGVLGLTLGGIIGGIAASRNGLKKWLWPMVWSITLPDLVYVYLSYFQSTNFLLINAMVFIEQFGYGFGFTAYMLFLLYYSQGEQQTSHYAFCTAFMALSMMLPGAVAGELQEAVVLPLLPYRNGLLLGDGRRHSTAENRPGIREKRTSWKPSITYGKPCWWPTEAPQKPTGAWQFPIGSLSFSVRVDSTLPCWNLPPSGKSCKRNCFPGWPPISKDRKRKPISIITVRDACLPSATRWDRPLPDSSPAPQPKSIPTCWGLHGPYADTKPALPAFWAPVPIPAVTTDRTLCNMCLRWDTS